MFKAQKKAFAVVGAGYGDEGKGLMTDALVQRHQADIVVRTNGGAQAGHTVVTPDGDRHVFSHFSSGAFAGARTHLSQFFVVHPMFFRDEMARLQEKAANTEVTVDPRAYVTTPYDIMINQIIEEARGSARHGSCGMGFGETIERNLRPEIAISYSDLSGSRLSLISKLERIRNAWVPERLQALGVMEIPESFKAALASNDIMRRYIDDTEEMLSAASIKSDADLDGMIIFEGAQGLMLDAEYGHFPHVTRSFTGIRNMVTVAQEASIGVIDVSYVTRAYKTRHGAGPLSHVSEPMDFADVVDPTNIKNDWQGSIRTAPLDVIELRDAVFHDLRFAGGTEIKASLAITCIDQIKYDATVYKGSVSQRVRKHDIPRTVSDAVGLPVSATSEGNSRDKLNFY